MPIPRSTALLCVLVVGFLGCVGCQSFTSSTAKGASTSVATSGGQTARSAPEVELVKNGVLEGHNSTTVGKAFEGTFQNAKWSSFETPKGATVVQFDGTATADALKSSGFVWYAYYDASATEKACIESLGVAAALKEHRDAFSEYLRKQGLYPDAATRAATQPHMDEERQAIDLLQKKVTDCVESTPIPPLPVRFQFLISADKKTFQISYVDEKVFGNKESSEALDFIYH